MNNSKNDISSDNASLIFIDDGLNEEGKPTANDVPDPRNGDQFNEVEIRIDIESAINKISNNENIKDVMNGIFNGLTESEISQDVGISPQTVHRRKVRGQKLIKEIWMI
jgi:DNA-directed RNA polymerase specialized sigma subunit